MSTYQPPSKGTKVTDPNAPAIKEPAGPVAADSLAAESDAFSQNRGGQPLGVSGGSSTFANTNTSGAQRLDPTPDAESRQDGSGAYPDALGGQDRSTGAGQTGAYTSGGHGGTGGSAHADTAPSYVNADRDASYGNPKGRNLTEGGFSSDEKNASFSTDIGGKNDPGRLAEQNFQTSNANTRGAAGLPTQKGTTGDSQYGVLGNEISA